MSQQAVAIAPPQRRLFTRAEYERAAELGLFGPGAAIRVADLIP